MVIHSNRIQAKRNTFLWCIKHDKEPEENNIELNEANGTDNNEQEKTGKKVENRRNNLSNRITRSYKFIELYWTKLYKFLIFEKIGKCIVFFLFCGYISFFSVNMVKIQEGINLGDLVADNSYYRAYIMDNVESVNLFPIVMLVVTEPMNYTTKTVRKQIRTLLDEAKKIDGISPHFEFNWMSHYENVLDDYKKEIKSNKSTGESLL